MMGLGEWCLLKIEIKIWNVTLYHILILLSILSMIIILNASNSMIFLKRCVVGNVVKSVDQDVKIIQRHLFFVNVDLIQNQNLGPEKIE